jgi:hypothetical protein
MEGEKTTTSPTENHPGSAPVAALQQFYEALDRMSPEEYAAKEKKLVRKIDQWLMPLLFLMIVVK